MGICFTWIQRSMVVLIRIGSELQVNKISTKKVRYMNYINANIFIVGILYWKAANIKSYLKIRFDIRGFFL